ncbi:MAG: amidohydrolase, partial [bacterium]
MQKFFIRMSALSISFWLLSCAQPKTADLIIYNGNIITVDENLPRAQAVAIKDEKILAVGSD